MSHNAHGTSRMAADRTGWLLGTIIVVLAVLDLLLWATLWNVPNPISKWLAPPTLTDRSLEPVRFAASDGTAQPAMLTGAPRTRVQ